MTAISWLSLALSANKALLRIGLAALLTACTGNQGLDMGRTPGQLQPVFDCYRVQSTWGYRVSGWLIDGDGDVYQYVYRGIPLKGIVQRNHSQDNQDTELLERKWAQRRWVGRVSSAELQVHRTQIDGAARGRISYRATRANDAGESLCVAMQWRGDRYDVVLLGSLTPHDTGVVNEALAGRDLCMWLRELGNKEWRSTQ